MSEINSFSDYTNKYNSNVDYSALFGGTSSSNMLAKIGFTIEKGNKLELDEDALKKSDVSSLQSVFTGYNSYASKISQKATSIGNAANRATATYTNNGTYSKVDYSFTSSKIDKEV